MQFFLEGGIQNLGEGLPSYYIYSFSKFWKYWNISILLE